MSLKEIIKAITISFFCSVLLYFFLIFLTFYSTLGVNPTFGHIVLFLEKFPFQVVLLFRLMSKKESGIYFLMNWFLCFILIFLAVFNLKLTDTLKIKHIFIYLPLYFLIFVVMYEIVRSICVQIL